MKKTILLIIFVLILLSSFVSAITLDDVDLVAFWNMDDAGTAFLDTATNSRIRISMTYDGALQQATAIPSFSTFALEFDGVNDELINTSASTTATLNGLDDFTIGCWINSSGDDRALMGFRDAQNGWNLRFATDTVSFTYQSTTLNANVGGNIADTLVIARRNSTHCSLWLNNTEIDQGDPCNPSATTDTFTIGALTTSSNPMEGRLDECFIMNRSLTPTEIDDVYTTGFGGAGLLGVPATPTIIIPSPQDNSNNNTNVTLNVSHSTTANDVRYYLYFNTSSTLNEGDLIFNNVTRNTSETSGWTTNVGDGTYYWKWRVQNITDGTFSANTTQRTLIIDTVIPTITIFKNTSFKTDNSTIISNYLNGLSINISFFDTYLFQTLINITNESNGNVTTILNTSLGGSTTANYTRDIDISGWSIGNYTIKLSATDSHTSNEIKEYDILTGLNYYRYTTEEGNVIKITSNTMPLTKDTTKLKDRYDFEFNYLFQLNTYKYTIESYNKIEYLKDSDYKAHFVIIGDNRRGNWIDFENPNLEDKDYVITKIDDYTYEVEITANGIKNFKFSSLGGLNTKEEHYLLRIGSVLDVWVGDGESGGTGINATVTINSQINNTVANITAARFVNITKETTSLTLTSDGFGTEEKTISITQNFHNFSFNLTPVSTAKLFFYDEKSNTQIGGETFFVFLETTGFSQTFSGITDNPHSITGLGGGLYKIKASSVNYPERQYFNLNISNITTTLLDIYLINLTDSSEIVFNVVDSDSEDLEDVNIDFYRTINGTRTLIAQEQTDFAGKAKLNLDTNYEYSINFTKTNYKQKIINLEPSATDSPYTIFLDGAVDLIPPLAVSYSIRRLFVERETFNLTYTNLTKVVHFSWDDNTNYVDNMCLTVYASNETFYNNCSTSTSDFMNYTITTDNRTYEAKAYAIKQNKEYTLKILGINLLQVIVRIGQDSLIFAWIAFITLGFLGLAKPFASMTLSIVGFIGMYMMGVLPISFNTIMGMIFVAITIGIGIGIGRSKQ